MAKAFALGGLVAGMLTAATASATYSIAASDSSRGQVGAAGASCVDYEVIRIHGSVDGRAVIEAQAYFDDAALAEAVARLGEGASPAAVLDAITDVSEFPNAPRMQYGIVDVTGRSVGWTGRQALPFATHVAKTDGTFAYAVQGNVLTSGAVIERMQTAFGSGGCDLADKLVLALEAAGEEGEGDSRCTPEGRPANSAFVEVSNEDGKLLRISVPDVSPEDPILQLREEYDAWRAGQPCEMGQGGSGGADDATGGSAPTQPQERGDGCVVSGHSRGAGNAPIMLGLALLILFIRTGPAPRP
jgi:uncharacterized Ntn-hydrolase superfamily protein